MQKHERECLKIAKAILEPHGYAVTYDHGRCKMVIIANNGSDHKHTVASSPREPKAQLDATRQWANRVLREVA